MSPFEEVLCLPSLPSGGTAAPQCPIFVKIDRSPETDSGRHECAGGSRSEPETSTLASSPSRHQHRLGEIGEADTI